MKKEVMFWQKTSAMILMKGTAVCKDAKAAADTEQSDALSPEVFSLPECTHVPMNH